jgi:hypothetical protein
MQRGIPGRNADLVKEERRVSMRKNLFVGVMLLVVAVIAVGCAKPPQQEIDAAKAALKAAGDAEAPTYAANEWKAANDAQSAVNAELEAQQAKFALFRSYTKAKQLIADAQNAANAAKQAGIAGKEKAKNEAQAAITAAKGAVEQAKTLVTDIEKCRRPKPKDFKKDWELKKGQVDGFAAPVADLDAKFAKEDFLGAKASADTFKAQVDAWVTEVTAVKTKLKC